MEDFDDLIFNQVEVDSNVEPITSFEEIEDFILVDNNDYLNEIGEISFDYCIMEPMGNFDNLEDYIMQDKESATGN